MTIINGTDQMIYWDGEPLYPLNIKLSTQKVPITINGVDCNMNVVYSFSCNSIFDISKIDYLIIDNPLLIKAFPKTRLLLKRENNFILL